VLDKGKDQGQMGRWAMMPHLQELNKYKMLRINEQVFPIPVQCFIFCGAAFVFTQARFFAFRLFECEFTLLSLRFMATVKK